MPTRGDPLNGLRSNIETRQPNGRRASALRRAPRFGRRLARSGLRGVARRDARVAAYMDVLVAARRPEPASLRLKQ